MPLKVTVDRTAEIGRAVAELTGKVVVVGLPGSTAARDDGITNPTIGYLSEFGSPAANIPARPWLVPGIQGAEREIADGLGWAADKALSGDPGRVQAALEAVGTIAQSAAQEKITDGPFAPLSPATIKNRWRGRETKSMRAAEKKYLKLLGQGKTPAEAQAAANIKPLINTGKFRDAVRWEVRDK